MKPIWLLTLFLTLLLLFSCSSSSSSSIGLDCTFDHEDFCGWQVLAKSANSSWHWTTDTRTIEPRSTATGTWLTTSKLDHLNKNFQYLISNVALNGSGTYCLTFWYYLLAIEDRSNIEVVRSTTAHAHGVSQYRSLLRSNHLNARVWTRQQVRIVPQNPQQTGDFNLMFVGDLQEGHANIGLDEIHLFEGECPVVDKDFCDFELNESCGWQLNGAEVLSNYVDHTTGTVTGHRVGFAHDQSNKIASMTKPMSTLTMFANKPQQQQVCLQFFYYMYTDLVADKILEPNASILVKVQNGAETITSYNISLTDTYNSDSLNMWTMFRANFEASKTTKIEIESHRTVQSTRLMIDDIRFSVGQCETEGNCDFETDMCGWINYGTLVHGDIVWLRKRANSGYIEGNRLLQDHTTGMPTGNYLVLPHEMIDDYYMKHLATLSSPLIINRGHDKLDNKMCFTMWYFVQTRETLMEAIEVRLIDIRQRRSIAYHATGSNNTSLGWKLFSVQFNNLPEKFQIQIRVLNPENILSNVGLDDIRLVPGDC